MRESVVSKNLRNLMVKHNLSAAKLAERAGIPTPSIKSILQGRSQSPRAQTLDSIARAFNCSIYDLISATSQQHSNENYIEASTATSEEISLFKECLTLVTSVAKDKGTTLTDNQRSELSMHLYDHALEEAKKDNTSPSADRVLAEWLISRAQSA